MVQYWTYNPFKTFRLFSTWNQSYNVKNILNMLSNIYSNWRLKHFECESLKLIFRICYAITNKPSLLMGRFRAQEYFKLYFSLYTQIEVSFCKNHSSCASNSKLNFSPWENLSTVDSKIIFYIFDFFHFSISSIFFYSILEHIKKIYFTNRTFHPRRIQYFELKKLISQDLFKQWI